MHMGNNSQVYSDDEDDRVNDHCEHDRISALILSVMLPSSSSGVMHAETSVHIGNNSQVAMMRIMIMIEMIIMAIMMIYIL